MEDIDQLERIYLDNNATTPVAPQVMETMLPYYMKFYGNPSSVHWAGREVEKAVSDARLQVAELIKAKPEEIIFTAGGSESDNFAILGSCDALSGKGSHIITTAVEHPAVLDTCRYFEQRGGKVTYLGVDRRGQIDLDELEQAINAQTVLISVMWANNETGTIFPVAAIADIARRYNIQFHCDAVQAVGKVPIDMEECPVDMLSISGHKIGAPKGIGVLYVRNGTQLNPYLHGGHQEGSMRAGTHNVAGIVALGKACQLAQQDLAKNVEHLRQLRDRLQQGIVASISDVCINGDQENRLPNTLNVGFSFVEGEGLLLSLDMYGIAASSGSACTSGSDAPSHVLSAMAVDKLLLQSSLRFSLGYQTTSADIDKTLAVLPAIVDKLRAMSPMVGDEVNVTNCTYVECCIDH
ncbi:MAG: cysteine desulfurase NifS [Desulfobacteraceae bacterium 4572_35.1]|nr:MAG: cysteine desulfurase NifS [Desulfobacteraceae bacterium 4572_35.1]